ncbi:hypothetical protein ACOCJ7_12935 [Knoellia sp. CPCC 206453]|uniref:hypothetical protein n=1 Tax=Knoellia pratensis TaxID=3404796 RepID=UPI0036184331
MRATSRRPIAYAVLAAFVVVLTLVVGWLTTPRTQGLEGEWETAAVRGEVLGGRALVGADSTVAIDLVSGTRITLGSVTDGTPAIGAGRLLVLQGSRLDGAGLDGRSRWTWQGPPAHQLALVAAAPSLTVAQACGGTPVACRLIGVDNNGKESWQTPQPTATGTSKPTVGADGSLPTVGVLTASDGTLLLVDPATSRVVLRPAAVASVGRDGALTLSTTSGGQCTRTTFQTLDRTSIASTPGPCPAAATGAEAGAKPGSDASATTTTTSTRSGVWWWPFGDGRPTLTVSGRHTGRVVSREALHTLRIDDTGLTVLDGETVRRYSWLSGG